MKPRRNALGQFVSRAHRNPDWHAIAASAKDKARRAHEWSKPHAAKAWDATKAGAKRAGAAAGAAAKRGSKKAAGSLAARLQKYAVANPDRPAPPSHISDAEIRRYVAGEASTAKGHRALAIAHDRTAQSMLRNGWSGWANYHFRMADAHSSMAHSLSGVRRAVRR